MLDELCEVKYIDLVTEPRFIFCDDHVLRTVRNITESGNLIINHWLISGA